MSERKLRVVHVIDSLAGSGGAENRLVDEVIALDERFEQVVVRLYERDFLDAKLTELGIPVLALEMRGGRAGQTWPWAVVKLRRVLRRWRPDVIHTSLFNANLVGQLAGATLHIPVVSTFNRTGEADLQRQLKAVAAGWKGRVMQAVGRWAARRGDVHYRAVGDYARATNCASMGLGLDRSTAVPRGVQISPSDVGSADRAAFDLPAEGPLFVNVARRVPEKAQHLLVEAFGKVRTELPTAHLAIAGESGPADGAVTAAVVAAGLGGAVHLLGFRSDARALVALADVFAFSSVSEGSPGVVVEALTLGAPLAAFDIPPVVELTDGGRHGWLAPVGSVDGLAQAMLDAYRAPDRAARVRDAQRWAERYRLATIAEQLGDLLERRSGRTPAPADDADGAAHAAEVVR
ncbi:MAG TPA: glycosyltransferase family 4 protein [Acidimicrobiales bacterium]|nr:glycosyltransferase family 4 protein [Acidimicrobiales bacterium]